MKWRIFTFTLCVLLISCVAEIRLNTQKVDASWKNPKYQHFIPSKIFVIGLCNNESIRLSFEECFSKHFTERGVLSNSCKEKYKLLFSNQLISDILINKFYSNLIDEGYNAVFVMALNGSSKQLDYEKEYYAIYHNWYRFASYAKYIQDHNLFPTYYSDYAIYNLECSMYEVNKNQDKSLIWAGVIKHVNPTNVSSQFNNFAKLILKELEQNKLIQKRT